jgi:GT2 family glycosyltransferase
MHKVTVGIPTLNNPKMLESCLKSIYATHDMYKNIDVNVLALDDGSNKENLELNKEICSRFGINLLMHKKNYGVAVSWNNLTRHFNSEIVILLNDDVEVSHNWIDAIIYTLDNNNSIGVVGLNAYEGDNSHISSNNIPTYVESKILLGGNLHPILSARGYAFGFRRADFDAVGGFESSYFCFFEEIDFNLSVMTTLGKRNCILSHPTIKHRHGATTFKELGNHDDIFRNSKEIFEVKWNVKWEKIRTKFDSNSIPRITEPLNEWNSNYNIWC